MTVIDVTERPVLKLGPDLFRFAYPSGVASGEAFGTAQLNATIVASGVVSGEAFGTASASASVSASGIAAAGGVGSPVLNASINAASVASSLLFGTAKTEAEVNATGVSSVGALGQATMFIQMSPSGFTSTGAVGSPALKATMAPTGVPSTAVFGDADTLATVFIIPGPVDPSNDFGNATATKKGWIFRPPVSTYQWRLFKEYEGISLLKESGTWSEVAHPDLERTRNAQKYLAGGRDHVVSTSLKAELEGLGYTVTEEFVTTEEYL